MKILAIRPEPGLSATLAAARQAGIAVEGCALSEVRPMNWQSPTPDRFDALLLGSANAVRHAGSEIARWQGRTAHVVGPATAEAALRAGLEVGIVGRGGLQNVVDEIAAAGPAHFLRLAGESHVPLLAPPGITIETRTVYRVVHVPLPDGLAARLGEGGVVLLHSADAARHFAGECDRFGISRERLALVALAPRIAEAAGEGWTRVEIAAQPADRVLLALARDICH